MEIFETWNSLESMQKKDIIHILNLKFIFFLFLLVLKYIFVQLSFLLNPPVFPIAIYIYIAISMATLGRQWDMPPPETHHALFCENNVNRFYCC